MKLLIDGDILVYQIAYSLECPIYVVGGGVYKRKSYAEKVAAEKGLTVKKRVNIEHIGQLRKNLDQKLQQIYEDLSSTDATFYITESKVAGNFRSDIAKIQPYKGNRKSVKPFHYHNIRKLLTDKYGALLISGQEADDAISIEATRLAKVNGTHDNHAIVSIDKDFLQVPGYHYNITKRTLTYVDHETGYKAFLKQLLTGDETDNIPGLTRLLNLHGREEESSQLSHSKYIKEFEKFALTHNIEEVYNYVVRLYKKYGYEDDVIDEIGNLLWLRRKEGELWSRDVKREYLGYID